jgi:Na+/H+ antiporter NhaD/arsenite permease-like protein
MDFLQTVIIPGLLIVGTVVIVLAILNFIYKMKLLRSAEKSETYAQLLKTPTGHKSAGLKWGLIILFAGVGLLIIGFLPRYSAPIPFAIEAMCIAFALLIHHWLENRQSS